MNNLNLVYHKYNRLYLVDFKTLYINWRI